MDAAFSAAEGSDTFPASEDTASTPGNVSGTTEDSSTVDDVS